MGKNTIKEGKNSLPTILTFIMRKKGYLISFNFNRNKKAGVKSIRVKDKIIIEAVV